MSESEAEDKELGHFIATNVDGDLFNPWTYLISSGSPQGRVSRMDLVAELKVILTRFFRRCSGGPYAPSECPRGVGEDGRCLVTKF